MSFPTYASVMMLFPQYSKENRVYTYAIPGGTTAYLQRFNDRKTIEQNIRDEIKRS